MGKLSHAFTLLVFTLFFLSLAITLFQNWRGIARAIIAPPKRLSRGQGIFGMVLAFSGLLVGMWLMQQQNFPAGSSSSASNQPNVINPTLAPYNAPVSQTCTFSALTVTNGSNVVTCSSATFTAANIGNVAWSACCAGAGGQNKSSSVAILAQGVIHDIISPTSVHICTTTGTCTPVNATANATAGAIFYWGTKADTQMALAIAASYAGPGPCSTFFWSGWIMVSAGLGNGPANCIVPIGATGDTNLSILGTGRANSMLLMTPDFNYATCTGLHSSCFFGLQGVERKYFGINGGGISNTSGHPVCLISSEIDDFDFDVGISDVGAQDGGNTPSQMAGYCMNGSGAYPNFVEVDGAGQTPIVIQSGTANTLVNGYAADVLGCTNGTNCGGCMLVKAGATVNTYGMYFGPANSAGAAQCVNVQSGGFWYSNGDICISGAGTNCVINNGGTIHLNNFTNPTDFSLTADRAIVNQVAAAKTYVTNSSLFGTVNQILNSAGVTYVDEETTYGSTGTNSGLAPTCAATTGGTGCALVAGSTNEKGTVRITASAVATGTVTLTFAGTFNGGSGTTPSCTFNYANTGTGAWSLTTTTPIVMTTRSSTVPVFNWNQTAALTAASTYDIDYVCTPR